MKNKNMIDNFDEDLFLTIEGQNILSYVKETYNEVYQFLDLNNYLKPILVKELNVFFENQKNMILQKNDISFVNETSYTDLIKSIDEKFIKYEENKDEFFGNEDNTPIFLDTVTLN
ncbi:hypothetical protein [Tenacibaculum ovolyticum]|uniref:hypothetical protein n=1 Tax=Tenacibaculum ovolyticum TaxID=104270 RepID=UPI0007ED4EDE|nr:hypothetical protein [Tenacibaculum ovolyticum]